MIVYTKYRINDDELRTIPSKLEHSLGQLAATELAESYEHEQGEYPDEAEYEVCLFTSEQTQERYKVYSDNVRRLFAEED